MRSPLDRLRHALSFEILALFLVIPLGALVFGFPAHDIGVVAIVSASIATLWNILYNYGFDLGLKRLTASTLKSLRMRVIHALLFEFGLLLVLMPFMAWYLEVSLWHALVMDAAFAGFYLIYALGFNWAYDKVFPLPEWQDAGPPQ